MTQLEHGKRRFQWLTGAFAEVWEFLFPPWPRLPDEVLQIFPDHGVGDKRSGTEQEHLRALIRAEVAEQLLQERRTGRLKARFRLKRRTARNCP